MFWDVNTNICDHMCSRGISSGYSVRSFGKKLRLRTRQSRIRIPVRERNISSLQNVNAGCGAHPSMYLVGPAFFSDGEAAWVEVNLLPLCSIEVKNVWCCTSTTPVCLHSLDMDNYIFIYLAGCTMFPHFPAPI
jgi:hypothetical protein